jgi:hypothetical protein
MSSSGGGWVGAELLVEYNGQKFKYNDLVHVIMGTGHVVVGKKCEPLKARFKGVVETVRGREFLCRPIDSWTLSSISATQCVQTECILSMRAGLEGDTLFLQIEAGHARKVNPNPNLFLFVFLSSLPLILSFSLSLSLVGLCGGLMKRFTLLC